MDSQGTPFSNHIGAAASALLAVHDFNERISDIVPEVDDIPWTARHLKLSIELYNTEYSPKKASKELSGVIGSRLKKKKKKDDDDDEMISFSGGSSRKRRRHEQRGLEQSLKSKEPPLPTAILGASRSQVTSPLAKLSSIFDIPQISYASTSPIFDNKGEFPLFGRLVPSLVGDAEAAVSYLHDVLNVSHLYILFVRDEYGVAYAQAARNACSNRGMTVESSSFAFDEVKEIQDAVKRLQQSEFRYCFGIFFQGQYKHVMMEAHKLGVAGSSSDRLWIFSDSSFGISSLKLNSKRDVELIEATSGSALIAITDPSVLFSTFGDDSTTFRERRRKERLSIFFDRLNSTYFQTVAGRSYFHSKLPSEVFQSLRSSSNSTSFLDELDVLDASSPFSLTMYESVMSVALALSDAHWKVGDHFTGMDLYDSFLNTDFHGIYGRVLLDKHTGTRIKETVPYSLSNIIPTRLGNDEIGEEDGGDVVFSLKTTHVYEHHDDDDGNSSNNNHPQQQQQQQQSSSTSKWKAVPNTQFIYPDSTTNPPPTLPPTIENKNYINTPTLIFGAALCAITLLLSLYFFLWIFRHKNSKVIRSSQPIFLGMLCVGTFMMGSAIVPMSLQEPVLIHETMLDGACMSSVWLLSIGFVVAFSALISKTMRINKIFNTKSHKRVTVRPHHVLGPFLILFTLNTIILSLWTHLNPLQYERITNTNAVDKFGRPTESYGVCHQPTTTKTNDDNESTMISPGKTSIYLFILVAINSTSLIYANYQAYLARHIETQYSESRYIALSMSLMLQVLLVGLPSLVLANHTPIAKFIVSSSLVTVTCVVILLPIFVPKLIFFREWKLEEEEREMKKKLRMTRLHEFQARASALSSDENGSASSSRRRSSFLKEGLRIFDAKEFHFEKREKLSLELADLRRANMMLEQQSTDSKKKIQQLLRTSSNNRGFGSIDADKLFHSCNDDIFSR